MPVIEQQRNTSIMATEKFRETGEMGLALVLGKIATFAHTG
jgi:hypothetical protein